VKPQSLIAAIVLMALLFVSGSAAARPLNAPVSTGFTYQGRLTDGGNPATGVYDFEFRLYDALSGGSQVGGIVAKGDVVVTNGLFTVQLDFGSVFNGAALYLDIGVRPGASDGDYTILSPRQPITATPYALYALSAPASNDWRLTGNAGTTPGSNFLGTTDNQALELRVNGGRALLIQPGAAGPNLVGGNSGNSILSGVHGGVVAGGGEAGGLNTVTDHFGVVGGGEGNTAGSNDPDLTNGYAATVAGGDGNEASGGRSTVGGGGENVASGVAATVPGGVNNTATGAYSFAAGNRAKANHNGAFVWADSQVADFASAAADTFRVRALNGATFQANNISYAGLIDNDGNGDGLRAVTTSSKGTGWGAVYANNLGTSPGIVAHTAGTYAGYFNGQLLVNGGCTGCTLIYVAQNTGAAPLEVGELVVAAGVGTALAGGTDPLLRVHQSGPAAQGVIGVVLSRAVVTPTEKEGKVLDSVQATDGAVQPGDYLLIVVQGLAQVKVANGEAVTPGQRLMVGDIAGAARGQRSLQVQLADGVGVAEIAETAPTLGVALEPAADGLVWMLVNPQ
jgi:hypothetical protein